MSIIKYWTNHIKTLCLMIKKKNEKRIAYKFSQFHVFFLSSKIGNKVKKNIGNFDEIYKSSSVSWLKKKCYEKM
jgi:hypothetical protein